MKRYINTLCATLVPFVVGYFTCYLVGSFVSVSFDPMLWTFETRTMCSVLGFLWGGGLYFKLMFEGLV